MFLIIGTLVHGVLGAGMRLLFGWRCAVVATIFAAKELGELKYTLPGTVKGWDKNYHMLLELFLNPTCLIQWTLPALAAWAVGSWMNRAGLRAVFAPGDPAARSDVRKQ